MLVPWTRVGQISLYSPSQRLIVGFDSRITATKLISRSSSTTPCPTALSKRGAGEKKAMQRAMTFSESQPCLLADTLMHRKTPKGDVVMMSQRVMTPTVSFSQNALLCSTGGWHHYINKGKYTPPPSPPQLPHCRLTR
ncbi:hypothetical protein COCON_G00190820 [Conger conger]|uniref:Uncharacterized protein n=1 Tax=Conger conger TaxID=82655 RepID=A0A9Q1D3J9_CONCO|nr:hypothetical protein COCON_G00190820 [Conger conger]